MVVKHWEKTHSDFALYEINEEFGLERLQQQQANQSADQAKRDKISLYGELELRSRLFQEDQARDCKEFEELQGICCEKIDTARQARIDEFYVHQERNPTTLRLKIRNYRAK